MRTYTLEINDKERELLMTALSNRQEVLQDWSFANKKSIARKVNKAEKLKQKLYDIGRELPHANK